MKSIDFVKILVDYWPYISIGLVILFDLILFIFKKRSKTEIIDPSAFSNICFWIYEAEKKYGPGEGAVKFKYVLDMYAKTRGLDEDVAKYIVDYVVDCILNTPTQKGGPGREDE